MENVSHKGYWGVLPGEVKGDPELTIAAKYLYIILSSMAYSDGYCWPSNEYLAGEIGLSKRRVVELLAQLRERGYIRIEMCSCETSHTGEQRYIYCGMFPKRTIPDGGCEIPHGDGAEYCMGGCEISHGEGAKSRTAYNSRKINKNNPPLPPVPEAEGKTVSAASRDEAGEALDGYAGEDGELRERLEEFREVRRQKKKPLRTRRAAVILTGRLDRLSGGERKIKLELLDTAILHGWDSVYPLKEDGGPPGRPDKPGPLRGKGVTYL